MTRLITGFLGLMFVMTFVSAVNAEHHEGKGSDKGSLSEEAKAAHHEMKGSMNQAVGQGAAVAKVKGTSEEFNIHGIVIFEPVEGGVEVNAHLHGVSPGLHGFHVHENGSCDDGGKAAGGHFNPHGTEHGFLPDDGIAVAHAGDMGNIEIDEDGHGKLNVFLPDVTISGDNNVAGRAVILHANEDDFGQPTGNAGPRIGCGVIMGPDEVKGSH